MSGQDTASILSAARDQEYEKPTNCGMKLGDLIERLLAVNASKRLSAGNLFAGIPHATAKALEHFLGHPFFSKTVWTKQLLPEATNVPYVVAVLGSPRAGRSPPSVSYRFLNLHHDRYVIVSLRVKEDSSMEFAFGWLFTSLKSTFQQIPFQINLHFKQRTGKTNQRTKHPSAKRVFDIRSCLVSFDSPRKRVNCVPVKQKFCIRRSL